MKKTPEKVKVVVTAKATFEEVLNPGDSEEELLEGFLGLLRGEELNICDADQLQFEKAYVRRGRRTKYKIFMGITLKDYVKEYGKGMISYMIAECLTPAQTCRVFAAPWKGKVNPRTMESYLCRMKKRRYE